jgi:Putative adhesin
MPTFNTPEPIFATIDLWSGGVRAVGHIQITASERSDTVVDISPGDASNQADLEIAEQTQVEFSNGHLLVKAPRHRLRSLLGRSASIRVTVELPAGSRVVAKAASADFRCDGRLGESKIRTADGDVVVARSSGHTVVETANGDVRVSEIDGTAVVMSANGDISVGDVSGDLRLSTANGDISVDRALATVAAKTAKGDVRIGEVVRGSVVLESAYGALELGVREGTAAWLDVRTHSGTVQCSLDASDGPDPSDETVEVRARTHTGDIVVRRSLPREDEA